MRFSPATSPMCHTSRSSDANAMCLSRTHVYPSLIQELKKEFSLANATDSHAYRVFNKSNGRVVESCDVTFDEDDRSLEERSASCEKGDAIPPDAIGRMGVGIRRPQELPSMSTGEGPSSTQVEPSTPQGQASSIDHTSASQPLQ